VTVKIKPCPFCGGTPAVGSYIDMPLSKSCRNLYYVQCPGCTARMPAGKPTEAGAVRDWNQRCDKQVKMWEEADHA
jgi:Lar family restriction alleviation protein